MSTFKEYLILIETAHTCPSCQNKFNVPDWLDTDLRCPKCGKAVNNRNNRVPSDSEQGVTQVIIPISHPDNNKPTQVSIRVSLDQQGNLHHLGRSVIYGVGGVNHQDANAADLIKSKQISLVSILDQAKKNLKFI